MTKGTSPPGKRFAAVALTIQTIFVILFGIFIRYDHSAFDPVANVTDPFNSTDLKLHYARENVAKEAVRTYGFIWWCMHIVFSCGFALTYIFDWSSANTGVGSTLLIVSLVMQWATLCRGFFNLDSTGVIRVSLKTLITTDLTIPTVLISWGAIYGRVTPTQLLIMAFFEVPLVCLNEWVQLFWLQIRDAGGAILCHVLSAYFGLAVSFILRRREDSRLAVPNITKASDLTGTIGIIMFFVTFPFLNVGIIVGSQRHRGILDTYFAVGAGVIASFSFSSILYDGKFRMMDIQNGVAAAGIAMAAITGCVLEPFCPLSVGIAGAAITLVSMKYLTPVVADRLGLQDTTGIHARHGLPGLFSAGVSAFVALISTPANNGLGLYEIYPAMRPRIDDNGSLLEGRSSQEQAFYQLFGAAATLALAVLGGTITGLVMKLRFFSPVKVDERFLVDSSQWILPTQPAPTEIDVPLNGQELTVLHRS